MMDSLSFYSYLVYFIYYYPLLFFPFYSFSLHKLESEEITTTINEISRGLFQYIIYHVDKLYAVMLRNEAYVSMISVSIGLVCIFQDWKVGVGFSQTLLFYGMSYGKLYVQDFEYEDR